MAKLTIEIEENEFALYDYEAYLDGVLFREECNFTSEAAALDHANHHVRSTATWIVTNSKN